MFSFIDPILFPDDVVIIQHPTHGYIMPIYKNGSSSLLNQQLPTVAPADINNIELITVIVRDPVDRYYSGVATYLNNFPDNLSKDTAIEFINQYLFLNRHFCPQLFWIINLYRFYSGKIKIKPMSYLSDLTHDFICPEKLHYEDVVDKLSKNKKIEFYLQMDTVLLEDFLNQTTDIIEIIQTIKREYPELYTEVFARSQKLCGVLD